MPQALPIIAAIGVGVSAYGTVAQMGAAKDQAAAQQRQVEGEMRAEEIRRRAMELEARRRQIEIVRTQQRARSMALATSTAQNASLGSGLQGGYGQISGQSGWNSLGVSQNLGFGQQLFGINQDISQARIGMAQAGSQAAFGAGLSSLGGSLVTNAGTLSSVGQSLSGWASSGSTGSYGGLNTYGGQIRGMGRGGIY